MPLRKCRYDDAYVYQNVFGPLLKLEADYDKSLKQSQARDNVGIRWDMGLNKKHLARFVFSRDDSELRVVPGDELKLKHVLPGELGLSCSRAAAWLCFCNYMGHAFLSNMSVRAMSSQLTQATQTAEVRV